ncbi:cytochrome P450 4g15-like [Neodiprion virginianus]|uniref:cytochrome P450 4g15-like n=1 Tax=Neodiprion virginianus TaxID=2961670 RepID=UPI001EE6A649|nr:cytochrome P450 4g15-like [Neodiprion virginianus]
MAVFYLLLILSAIFGAIYYYLENSRIVKMGHLIPGPPTVPFLGNALIVLNVEPTQIIDTLSQFTSYGKVIRAFMGPLLYVFIIDPKDIEIILSSHVHIDKSFEYRFFKPWLGEGLLISTGEKWRSHRKIIAPTFHLSILRTFVPLFYENSKVLVSKMREVVGKEFDCHDYLSATTVDILLETAMGVKDTKMDGAGFEYAMAVMKMCDIVHRRSYKLWTRFDFFFNLTKSAKTQEKLLGTIHGLTNNVIKEKRSKYDATATQDKIRIKSVDSCKNIEPEVFEKNSTEEKVGYDYVRDDLDDIDENDVGEKKRLAFLDLMMELARNGANLTDVEIKEEVDTIMFEGHDTTAAGSSFVLCLLGYYQDIQEKVCQELDEIFEGSDRETTFNDTLEMKYLERVILETLRLFPPVPLIARKLNEDVKLVTGGYVIPEGATVLIPTYQVHRQEEIYPNPEQFNPDNFLPENMQQRHYYGFIPFSAGPRSCVGRKYAMLKLKVLLSTVLRHYKILSDVPVKEFHLVPDIILKRADGFRIRIEPRNARVRSESHSAH